MTNLLQFPTGLLTPLLILVALYVLFSLVAWALGDDEPVDEIRQEREGKFAAEQRLKGLHQRPVDKIQQDREKIP